MNTKEDAKASHGRKITITAVAVAAIGIWAFFPGSVSAVSRSAVSSLAVKVTILALTAVVVLYNVSKLKLRRDIDQLNAKLTEMMATRDSDKQEIDRTRKLLRKLDGRDYSRQYTRAERKQSWLAGIGMFAVCVLAVALAGLGGYVRGQTVSETVQTTDTPPVNYQWRIPWDVASLAVTQRAQVGSGSFAKQDTTYLPGQNSFSTPVIGKGANRGFVKVAVQNSDNGNTTVCSFKGDVPRKGAWLNNNLRYRIAKIDRKLLYDNNDVWGWCDRHNQAQLVVPVSKMHGNIFGEQTPTPEGIVVFDGKTEKHIKNVKPGAYPGPVYPMSAARAQRLSMESTGGILDKVFNRAGWELSENSYVTGTGGDGGETVEDLNNSELLLRQEDSDRYDYVTPLTERSNSQLVVAVATVAGDRVEAGKFNEMTVHTLEKPRTGNVDIVNTIRANFPGLGWETGVAVAEIIPTGSTGDTSQDGAGQTVWEASLHNGGVVAGRIRINGDSLCLLNTRGELQDCTTTNTSDSPGEPKEPKSPETETNPETGFDEQTPSETPTSMQDMTDSQLLDVIDQALEELRSRDE